MLSYELDAKHLPGYANNQRGKTVKLGGVDAALYRPQRLVGRARQRTSADNGWRKGISGPSGLTPVSSCCTNVNLFVCPTDSPTANYPLSYVVNVGWSDTSVTPNVVRLPDDDSSHTNAYVTQVGLFVIFR